VSWYYKMSSSSETNIVPSVQLNSLGYLTPEDTLCISIPGDAAMQQEILGTALELLERAWMPRTTVQTPYQWPDDAWRENFMRVDASNREELARQGKERRDLQARLKKS